MIRMVVEYIFIERDERGIGKGDINIIKPHYRAILNLWKAGKLLGTLFQVNAPREDIDKVIASHPDVKHFATTEEVQIFGMIAKSRAQGSTPTVAEVDELVGRLKTKYGIDLVKYKHPDSGKNLIRHFKEEVEHIGSRRQKCLKCGTIQGEEIYFCKSCGTDLQKKGNSKLHIPMFDIDVWIPYKGR